MTHTPEVTLTIDGHPVTVPATATIFQACEAAGVEVPHFCYHAKLKVAGNCRMCLVQVAGNPKPVASCAMPVSANMAVITTSEMVQQAREGVMGFLLINHPLDCPVCDQGGACDLQDQAFAYGGGQSQFDHPKRAVASKNMGPLINTYMNRCIHCTRCVRFAEDIAGVPALGAVGRGEDTEIITYMDEPFYSELSGNIVDLCPVGALTSRPRALTGRAWELTKTNSIDVMDAVGAAIRIDTLRGSVQQILPREDAGHAPWISDKTRYACDGLTQQRIDRPFIRREGRLQPATWPEALEYIAQRLQSISPHRRGVIAGDLTDVETMTATLDLFHDTPHRDCRQGEALTSGSRARYLFNTPFARIAESDFCLLIGTHPRFEAPLINAQLYQAFRATGLPVYRLGALAPHPQQELTYPVHELGADPQILNELLQDNHPLIEKLKSCERPMLILGMDAHKRKDGAAIASAAAALADQYMIQDDWNGFNVLHQAASRVGGLDIGFVPQTGGMNTAQMLQAGALDALYLLGADEIDLQHLDERTFVIYQGHHGDRGAEAADVVLPGCAYTEKEGTYVNTLGRIQRTRAACAPPGEAQEDWRILLALSQAMGQPLPYTDLAQIQKRMAEINPVFAALGRIPESSWEISKPTGEIAPQPLAPWSGSFYMSNVISRHSATMARCRQTFEEPLLSPAAGACHV